jgi:hypothetical protein
MKIKYVVKQLDSHAHLSVYTSERHDLKCSMGHSGNVCMTAAEWEDLKNSLVARFGASHLKEDRDEPGESYTFILVP